MVNVAMVITCHKPVTMETKGQFGELQMFALRRQTTLDVGHLTQESGEMDRG